MKEYYGNYQDFRKMTQDELLDLISTMTPEEKEDLENNYIAEKGTSFFGVKSYIAHKYFPAIFNPVTEPKESFSARLEALLAQ